MSDRIIHSVLTDKLRLANLLLILPCTTLILRTAGVPIVGSDFPYSARIVGGQPAKQGDHPYLVSISHKIMDGSGDYQFSCGGVILDSTTIITAAHCFGADKHECWKKDPEKCYRITAGELEIDSNNENQQSQTVYVNISNIIIHEGYNNKRYYNDTAIIILDAPLNFSDNVGCINLPRPNLTFEDQNAKIAGWGLNSSDSNGHQRTLQDVDVKIHCDERCKTQWGDDFDSKYMICAGGDIQTADERGLVADACYGDSGGPLVYENHPGHPILVGLISWGYECGYKDFPGVYTRVTKHLNWIFEKVPRLRSRYVDRRRRRFHRTRGHATHCHSHSG